MSATAGGTASGTGVVDLSFTTSSVTTAAPASRTKASAPATMAQTFRPVRPAVACGGAGTADCGCIGHPGGGGAGTG
jgi:hypothetical protein